VGFDLATPRAERLLAEEKLAGWAERVAWGPIWVGVAMAGWGLFVFGVLYLDAIDSTRSSSGLRGFLHPLFLTPFLLFWATGLGLLVGGIKLQARREWARRLLVHLSAVGFWVWMIVGACIVADATWMVFGPRPEFGPHHTPEDLLVPLTPAVLLTALLIYLRRLHATVTGRIVTAACATPSGLPDVAEEGLAWRDGLTSLRDGVPHEGRYVLPASAPQRVLSQILVAFVAVWVVGDLTSPAASSHWQQGGWFLLAFVVVTLVSNLPEAPHLVTHITWDREGVRLRTRLGRTGQVPWDRLDEVQATLPVGEHEPLGRMHLFVRNRPRPYVIPIAWGHDGGLLRVLRVHVLFHDMPATNTRRTPPR
jgi:hypothetical protein